MARTGIRAAVAKVVLAQVESFPDARRDQLLRAIPHEVQLAVKDGLSLDWLDAAEYHLLVNPVFNILGAAEFRSLYTEVYVKLANLPVLSALTRAALQLGGVSALGLAKHAPGAWRHLSRGIGELDLISATHPPHLRYRGYPTHLGPPELFAYSWAGTFDGFFRLCGSEQTAAITSLDPATGSATFSLS